MPSTRPRQATTGSPVLESHTPEPVKRDERAIVREVYGALTLSLVVTFLAGILGREIDPLSDAYYVALFVPFLIIPFLHMARSRLGGLLALGSFAFAEGLSFGCLYQVVAVDGGFFTAWWTAVGITVATFGGLTAYVWATREDFHWMKGALYNTLWLMIVGSLGMLWFGAPLWMELASAGFGIFLFSAFILHDTSEVLNRIEEKDAYVAACHLYLDILNLFLELLRILMYLMPRD